MYINIEYLGESLNLFLTIKRTWVNRAVANLAI